MKFKKHEIITEFWYGIPATESLEGLVTTIRAFVDAVSTKIKENHVCSEYDVLYMEASAPRELELYFILCEDNNRGLLLIKFPRNALCEYTHETLSEAVEDALKEET